MMDASLDKWFLDTSTLAHLMPIRVGASIPLKAAVRRDDGASLDERTAPNTAVS